MNSERRRQLEERYEFSAWKGLSAHATGELLRDVTFTGQELPSWELQRADRKAGPPPRITVLWLRRGAPESALRVDLFVLPSVNAAHDTVIELLNDFQASEIVRREQPPIGDVCFGTPLVQLFARANAVVLVRNAGRQVVEVVSDARALDAHLAGLLTRGGSATPRA